MSLTQGAEFLGGARRAFAICDADHEFCALVIDRNVVFMTVMAGKRSWPSRDPSAIRSGTEMVMIAIGADRN